MNKFVERMIRAATLDVSLYEEVEADTTAMGQAMEGFRGHEFRLIMNTRDERRGVVRPSSFVHRSKGARGTLDLPR